MNGTSDAKRTRSRWLCAAGAAAIALGTSACIVVSEPTPQPHGEVGARRIPPASQGTLVLRWTIDGSTDPTECTKSASSELEVALVDDQTGHDVGAWRQNCQVFSLSVPLDPGTYSGTARLLDAAGQARTTSVTIDPFSLRGNDTFEVPVDFPGDSFF